MKHRSFISIAILICLIAAIIAGCATGGPSGSDNSSSTAGEKDSTSASTDSQANDAPLSVHIGTTWPQMVTPCTTLETEVVQYIMEKENIDINVTVYDSEKWNLMFASMDFPDIVTGSISAQIPAIIESKLALNLDEYIDTYAPHAALDIYETSLNLIRRFKSGGDGNLYFIPQGVGLELANGGSDVGRGYSLRWDWYKEAGAPVIESDEDYLDVVEKMVAAHPETESGKKVYGWGVASDFANWYMRACFVKPALVMPWMYGGYLYMVGFDDNVLYNGYTNTERSAFWEDMKFYREAYRRGLLDPDSFTQTGDQLTEKYAQGIYAACTEWQRQELYEAERKKDESTIAGMIRVPSPNALCFANNLMIFGDFPYYGTFVPATTKNIEGAMKIIDINCNPEYIRTICTGIEGKHWNYENGVPTLTKEAIELRANGGEDWARTGINNTFSVFVRSLQPSFILDDGYPADLTESPDTFGLSLNPLQRDLCAFYDVSYPSEASLRYVESGDTVDLHAFWGDLSACLEEMPSDITRILKKCNDILYKAVPSLIMAGSDAEYEAIQAQVMKDLEAADEATAWAWAEKNYNNAKDIFAEYAFDVEWAK